MPTLPFTPSEACASDSAPLYGFAASLAPLGLPNGNPRALFLRFEPMGPLRSEAAAVPGTVGVLATWRCHSLAHGTIDHVARLSRDEAEALLIACAAAALPVVNNLIQR